MTNIWHFSDSHGMHEELVVPENIDIAIFSGDCSNDRAPTTNEPQVINFLNWFAKIPCTTKIFVAGNHDTSIEKRLVHPKEIREYGIIYLENESVTVDELNIWGSPITPMFQDWAFMRDRSKLHKLWMTIPEDTDIVVTHGPPKGVMDLTENRDYALEMCGCSALAKRIMSIQPKLCLFGHIHSGHGINNNGIRKYDRCATTFSNGSCVEDGKFAYGPISDGNILTI